MIGRLRDEDGYLIVTAMVMIGLMMSTGLAAYAFVDTQQRQSSVDRQRESSFTLGEGALSAQSFVLPRHWPGSAGQAYPATCSWTSGASQSLDQRCPNAAELARAFSQADFAAAVTWTVKVRDDYCLDAASLQVACNGGPGVQFYDQQVVDGRPSWDQNKNDMMWVRADAVVRGSQRSLAALVGVERVAESFPHKAVIAGRLTIPQAGNQTYVVTDGRDVALRCLASDTGCVDYRKDNNVSPLSSLKYGQYVGQTAIPTASLDRLKARAIADGTYSTSCPPSPAGAVVFVESPSAVSCAYDSPSQASYNSPTSPGVFIVTRGSFSIGANDTYYGVIYAPNLPAPGSSGVLISTTGGGTIVGGAFVDGPGAVAIGNNAENLVFDERAFTQITSYGTAGVVQNTWREVPAP